MPPLATIENLLSELEVETIRQATSRLLPRKLKIRKQGQDCYEETLSSVMVWEDGTLSIRCTNSKGSYRTYISEAKRLLNAPAKLGDLPPVYRKYTFTGKPPLQGTHILFGEKDEVLERMQADILQVLKMQTTELHTFIKQVKEEVKTKKLQIVVKEDE